MLNKLLIKLIGLDNIKKFLINLIEENKSEVIEWVNEKIDIPKMSEKKEKVFFEKLYETVLFIVKSVK